MYLMLHAINKINNQLWYIRIFPHNIPFPKVSTDDYLKQATQDIIQLLTHPIAQLPYLQVRDVTKNAILQIAQMLNRSIDQVVGL